MLSYEIILITFIKLCHHKNSIIHKLSNLRQRITEQTAYARCHVYARALKLILWNDLKSNHAKAASLPYRADAQKIEKLSYEEALDVPGGKPKDMCEVLDRVQKRGEALGEALGEARGIEITRLQSIQSVMEGLGYTAQQAMDLLKIPPDEQPKFAEKL